MDAVKQQTGPAGGQDEPDHGGNFAELKARERQRAVGDEFALRNQNDARDGEHHHDRQRQQRIDGAVGEAILREQQCNIQTHCLSRQRFRQEIDACPKHREIGTVEIRVWSIIAAWCTRFCPNQQGQRDAPGIIG